LIEINVLSNEDKRACMQSKAQISATGRQMIEMKLSTRNLMIKERTNDVFC